MLTRRMLWHPSPAPPLGTHRGGLSAGLSIAAHHHDRAFSCGRANGYDCTHVSDVERFSGSVCHC